jgi:hypothetical protein
VFAAGFSSDGNAVGAAVEPWTTSTAAAGAKAKADEDDELKGICTSAALTLPYLALPALALAV